MIKRKASLPFFIGLAVAVGILIGGSINFKNKAVLFSSNTNEAKIKKLINYIQYDYVDEVDTDSLLDDAIANMLVKLDPHSVYFPKEELKQVTDRMQGKFVGIGVTFLMHKDSVTVTGVIEGGPSFKAGLKAGDRIIAANKDSLFGQYVEEKAGLKESEKTTILGRKKISDTVMGSLKGEIGTDVVLTVYRRSADKVMKVVINRDEVPLKSVPGYYMVNNTLGYINIERFARTTYKEFKKALIDLNSKGMTALALDLRGNPGGYMDITNNIIDEFLEDGKLIVFTKNKNGDEDKSYATSYGDFENGRVYVLIDQNSASASEIVAGALQDNDKGTIVGRRSFGKGLVQQQMDLGDGSAVRLTTSRYYTPTGRSIQKPYEHKSSKKYNSDYITRMHNGELISKDSIKVNDSLRFTTPKGKVVYGGGGIIPDVFVPLDTTRTYNSKFYRGLNSFVFEYIDNHREEFVKWKLDEFVTDFDKDSKLFDSYLDEINLKLPLAPEAREDLKMYFKAFFARDLFGKTGYFVITQKKDNMIEKVIELDSAK